MKILTYRDLDSKDELLPLMDHAFRWPFNPRTFEWFVKSDPTKKDGPVGFLLWKMALWLVLWVCWIWLLELWMGLQSMLVAYMVLLPCQVNQIPKHKTLRKLI